MAEFFRSFEEKCFKNADERPLSDSAGRDRAYFLISLMRKLRNYLEYLSQGGEDAQRMLGELLGREKSLKERIFG